MESDKKQDDGSLAFLKIPRNPLSRSFNCPIVRQSDLVNTSFWLIDFIEDVPTRFSKAKGKTGQTLVKIKQNKDDPDSAARKFFSGSEEMLYVLKEIRKLDAFPRKVTMRGASNRYFFE